MSVLQKCGPWLRPKAPSCVTCGTPRGVYNCRGQRRVGSKTYNWANSDLWATFFGVKVIILKNVLHIKSLNWNSTQLYLTLKTWFHT